MVDMSQFIEPKSDQMNADDLLAGPRTIRIIAVKASPDSPEQPVSINFEGDKGKPFKPCKSMRRVLIAAWGADGSKYIGRSMTLYRDPKVKFGGIEVGGIRISHMSDLDRELVTSLTVTKAKRSPYVVKPLKAKPKPDVYSEAAFDAAMAEARKGKDAFVAWWQANAPLREGLKPRMSELQAAAEAADAPPEDPFPTADDFARDEDMAREAAARAQQETRE